MSWAPVSVGVWQTFNKLQIKSETPEPALVATKEAGITPGIGQAKHDVLLSAQSLDSNAKALT